MKFFVIYSFDCIKSDSVKRYQPPKVRTWEYSEGDEQFEYDYLEGDWVGGKHRKYCRTLSESEFFDFVNHCELEPEGCKTMGSLTGDGWMPAISMRSEQYTAIVSAYITPIPEGDECDQIPNTEQGWVELEQCMQAILEDTLDFELGDDTVIDFVLRNRTEQEVHHVYQWRLEQNGQLSLSV